MKLNVILAVALLTAQPLVVAAEDGETSIEAAGTTYPAFLAGSGKPAVLVHGLFVDDRAWSGLLDSMGEHRRAIAYTQRGFGVEDWQDATFARDRHAEDLVSILGSLGEPADLVGWSYGSPIVLNAAIVAAELVSSVVVYEPYVPELLVTPEGEASADSFNSTWGPIGAAIEDGDDTTALELTMEAVFSLPPGGFQTLNPAARTMFLENAHTVRSQWNSPDPTPLDCEALGGVRAPTLIIYGSASHPFFAEMAKALAGCMPDAKLAVLEGLGHDAPLTAAPEVAEVALTFLDAR